jgi:hypothetical protein
VGEVWVEYGEDWRKGVRKVLEEAVNQPSIGNASEGLTLEDNSKRKHYAELCGSA